MPILALIDKSSPRESRSEFLPRTHPIHSNMSKNHVLVLFELFHPGQKHRIRVCQYVPILALLTKFRGANHEVCFCHEHTQYTPICPKFMFGCFLNLINPVKNIAPVGSQHMPILALIHESSSREPRIEFLPRTHPIHSIMSKNHVLVLSEIFHSGRKHCTHVCQYISILALIDKSSPRESRNDFSTRTHPIQSNMSKNHVLVLFEGFL